MNSESKIIDALGGPTEVAKKLGYKLPSGAARVSNWKKRGIPAKIKLEFPWMFLRQEKENDTDAPRAK